MNTMPAFRAATLFGLLLVLSCAAFTRIGYLVLCTERGELAPALLVQDPPPADRVAVNMAEYHWFGGSAPLADEEEETAHIAPGFATISTLVVTHIEQPARALRWAQCVLGILTVGCFFFFARLRVPQ